MVMELSGMSGRERHQFGTAYQFSFCSVVDLVQAGGKDPCFQAIGVSKLGQNLIFVAPRLVHGSRMSENGSVYSGSRKRIRFFLISLSFRLFCSGIGALDRAGALMCHRNQQYGVSP